MHKPMKHASDSCTLPTGTPPLTALNRPPPAPLFVQRFSNFVWLFAALMKNAKEEAQAKAKSNASKDNNDLSCGSITCTRYSCSYRYRYCYSCSYRYSWIGPLPRNYCGPIARAWVEIN